MELHALLKRQLRRVGVDLDADRPEHGAWRELLQRVSRAYEEHDQERYLLERSQDLASEEMAALYATVRDDRDLLESRASTSGPGRCGLSEGRLDEPAGRYRPTGSGSRDAVLRFTYISDGIGVAAGIPAALLIGRQRLSSDAFDAPAEAVAAYEACIDARKPFRDFTYACLHAHPTGYRGSFASAANRCSTRPATSRAIAASAAT